ncbi:MAG: Serine--tRNA ligase [candidate division WS6 bacterium OLB20]|uniref:serine--tRNA ligase n=1 Tax=candidate division WS6 bacterium OLB20 TaxID=1617426 RepID=A0A136LZ56_9BACT|nr:MAG: Serine--tRNA ligase [candidate division WS6 bacterium OLB20]
MNVVCAPDQSDAVFDELLEINEWLLQTLELPYHLVLKCTGDAGYHASAKQIDPEVWLPGQKEFMEVMTDTNTTDFQARRLNIKYTTKDGKREYVHTCNDTGVAMGRMLVAIMDNYQQADGTVRVPQALVPFMGKDRIEAA